MANGIRLTNEEFIKRSIEKHNGYYSYPDNLIYKNYYTKVPIICPKHGEFYQKPSEHLSGKGCKLCGIIKSNENSKKTFESFEKQGKLIHNNKYSYNKKTYSDVKTKTLIICPIHGGFWQTPDNHIHGKKGCPQCSHTWISTMDEIIDKCKAVHGDKYDYSKFDYINSKQKGIITCKLHGPFLQDINHHLQGHGCPKCNSSNLENEVEIALKDNNIKFEKEKRFDWLKNKKKLPLDFYLPDYNIAIECQGIQHYKPIEIFGGIERFVKQTNRDKLKQKLCEDNNIKLLYYSKSNLIEDGTYNNVNDLIKYINGENK